jgi:hypothetical protein
MFLNQAVPLQLMVRNPFQWHPQWVRKRQTMSRVEGLFHRLREKQHLFQRRNEQNWGYLS